MSTCARSSAGTSIRRPAARSGWTMRRSSDGIPDRRSRASSDLARFGLFEDEWLRGGPVQRWMPKGLAGKPVYVFETGGTTGTPKTRVAVTTSGPTTRCSATRCRTSTFRRGSTG